MCVCMFIVLGVSIVYVCVLCVCVYVCVLSVCMHECVHAYICVPVYMYASTVYINTYNICIQYLHTYTQ